jgi:hypothetical protein
MSQILLKLHQIKPLPLKQLLNQLLKLKFQKFLTIWEKGLRMIHQLKGEERGFGRSLLIQGG